MHTTTGVQVRGDLCDLLFYQQHESPDGFDNYLAPYRKVRDFNHAVLPGGVRLFEKLVEAELRLNNVLYHYSVEYQDDTSLLRDNNDAPIDSLFPLLPATSLAACQLEMQANSLSQTKRDWITFYFEDQSSFIVDCVSVSLTWKPQRSVDLKISASAYTARHIRETLKDSLPVKRIEIESNQEYELSALSPSGEPQIGAATSVKLALSSYDSDSMPSAQVVAGFLRELQGNDHSIQLDHNGSSTALAFIAESEFPLHVNLQINSTSSEMELGMLQLAPPNIRISEPVKDILLKETRDVIDLLSKYPRGNSVILSTYGPWTPKAGGARSNPAALWEVNEFGKNRADDVSATSKKVFRLKGPRGYIRTIAEQINDARIDDQLGMLRELTNARNHDGTVAARSGGYDHSLLNCTRFEYLCLIDLGYDYVKSQNRQEWTADLMRLQQAENNNMTVVADVAQSLPPINAGLDAQHLLFSVELRRSLCKQAKALATFLAIDQAAETETHVASMLLEAASFNRSPNLTWDGDVCTLTLVDPKLAIQCEVIAELGTDDFTVALILGLDDETEPARTVRARLYIYPLAKDANEAAEIWDLDAILKGSDYSLWDYLYCFFRRNTIAVVSAHILRAHGHPISHRLSWEKTAQACVAALQSRQLRQIASFAHLVVRTGVTGAIHVYQNTDLETSGRMLYFDPIGNNSSKSPDAFYRDVSLQGHVISGNTVLCASIVAHLIKYCISLNDPSLFSFWESITPSKIGNAIQHAIRDCQQLYDEGYGSVSSTEWGWGQVLEDDSIELLTYDPAEVLGAEDTELSGQIPPDDRHRKVIGNTPIVANPRWRITEEASRAGLYPVACKIVLSGVEKALNAPRTVASGKTLVRSGGELAYCNEGWPSIAAPIVRFGSFVTVDRDEAESLRNIDYVLREYRRDTDNDKPISIAVFGPPGAGKSFSVTEMMNGIYGDPVVVTCNLSQMNTPEDLGIVLLKFKDAASGGTMRVLFVDEFDSSTSDRPLGWLRYFLALMQDGKFKHGNELLNIGKCILVFAGGIFQTFEDFAGQSSASSDEKRLEFSRAKGPDFVSRLSGHINMIGINPRDEYDDGHVVRRAVLLRSMIAKRKLVGHNGDSVLPPALIEAMLRVSQYYHGARSMEIVLKTCVGEGGKLWLPTLPQLRMHIDADQLVELYEAAQRDPTIVMTKNEGVIVDAGGWA